MLTKAGGVVLVAHGIDTLVSCGQQIWSGDRTKTLPQQRGEAIAYSLGADQTNAERTGIVIDIAVPIVVAPVAAAVRLASVRAGRIVLADEELAGEAYGAEACRTD